jgi:hypothetical protein
MTDFTVTAAPAGWLSVAWDDDTYEYWFTAEVEGDTVTRLRPGGVGRTAPTVYRKFKGGGRGSLSYQRPDDFAEIIVEATALIAREGLATKAFQRQLVERAEREAQWIKDKAARARELLQRHGLRVPEGRDDQFAAFYDDLQNAMV